MHPSSGSILMQKSTFITLAVLTVLVLFLFGCTNNSPSGLATASAINTDHQLKIGIQTQAVSTLVMVADQEGFFKNEGLNVELANFSAGKYALQALLANQVDFAVVGDVPIVLAAMNGNELYVIGQPIKSSNENKVIALKDSNTISAKEYFSAKKRKISTTNGATAELFTIEFLDYYGIDQNQVELVYQKPEDMVAALSSRSVDAISIFEPYPYIAEKKMSGAVIGFDAPQDIYHPLYSIVAQKQLIDENPQTAIKLLKALKKAEDFVKKNPEEAQLLVAKESGFALDEVNSQWNKYVIELDLSDRLIANWNEVANWAIKTNKTKSSIVPDFNKIIRKDLFEEAMAGAS